MVPLRSLVPLLLMASLSAMEDFISAPSCEVSAAGGVVGDAEVSHPDDLKVMMVADLLLLGSDAGYADSFFRDSFMSKFFRKSFESLKPDMLVVLGDMSAKGWEFSRSEWLTVLQQFYNLLGPFSGLPLHIALGDRDLGECTKLDENTVSWIAGNLQGLDSAGCSVFEISNVSFVSLSAVPLLCGNNILRFSVERVVENESIDLRNRMKNVAHHNSQPTRSDEFKLKDSDSGPVLLLHFPLHRKISSIYEMDKVVEDFLLADATEGHIKERAPYELMQTLPANATEYIFQALKPMTVFSAHAHKFCDYTHPDGTREVTLPAMTWASKENPGFVFATFRQNKAVTVSHCSLVSELHVILAYLCFFILFVATLNLTW